jgi:hypothetical protein
MGKKISIIPVLNDTRRCHAESNSNKAVFSVTSESGNDRQSSTKLVAGSE